MRDRGPLSRTRWQLACTMAIAKKDARIYYLKPPVLIFGVFFPVCLFCAFAFGRGIPPTLLLPGMLGMTLFFISSSSTPLIVPWETLFKTLEGLVSTPASIGAIISGGIIAGFLYGIFVSLFPLSAGFFVFGANVVNPAVLILDIVLSALCFAAMGSLLSTPPTETPANIMLLSNIIRLPLIFISGVFIPIEKMPGWGKMAAAFSPLTYSCDLARHALLGRGYYPITLGLVVLSVFTIGFFLISLRVHKKTMPKRIA